MPRLMRRSASTASEGTAYVYVAPCRHENILKLGFSRDPLARLQSLHPRWYDFFDLDSGWLVETDRVREARALELQLRRGITPHNAPSPSVVVRAAAGHTEWFRGALPALGVATEALVESGHLVHRPLREWVRPRLEARSDQLFHWSADMLEAIEQANHVGDPRRRVLERNLRDVLDAWPALGLPLAQHVSEAVAGWHGGPAAI
jgi:hypothetical protein